MNAINKIELNQEINDNYDKLVYLHEQYEFTFNKFDKLKTDLKREQKRDIAGYYISHNIRLPIEELNGIRVDIFLEIIIVILITKVTQYLQTIKVNWNFKIILQHLKNQEIC